MSGLIDWLVQNEPSFPRLPSLFSDLTVQKTTNPHGFAANVASWQSALTRAAAAGQLPQDTRLILQTSDKLLNALVSSAYGRPSGLGAVIDESVRDGKMIDLREFQTTEKSIYSRSWVPSPWSVLQWSLRQIGFSGGKSYEMDGHLRVGNLVLVQALEETSKQVLAAQAKTAQGITDRIVSREAFVKDLQILGAETVSDRDVQVLLRYLERDKQALSFDLRTVKFKAPNSLHPEPITTEDTTTAELKLLISNLNTQVATLETRVTSLQAKVLAAVKSGNKNSALSTLRSKKLAEKNLQQRSSTLQQLEEVYTNIEQAVDQVDIVKAMEASAGVLKGLNQKVGGVERVEEVVDRLREEMMKVDEVGQVISEPLDQKVVLDEEEVDEELAAMEAEQHKVQEEAEAEKTRKRLQELAQTERQQSEGEPSQKYEAKTQTMEEQLEASTKRLSGMSIEDDQETLVQGSKKAEAAAEHA